MGIGFVVSGCLKNTIKCQFSVELVICDPTIPSLDVVTEEVTEVGSLKA